MNEESFLRYVENTRDCEEARLDLAVRKGLYRAKSERPDHGKFLALAAACAFTFTVCFTVNFEPFNSAAKTYFLERNNVFTGKDEILNSYMEDMTVSIETLAELGFFRIKNPSL